MVLAYIIGSDVTIRAGEAFGGTSYFAGWHLTGTCGVFGATAAACKVMGLSPEQYVNALGVAGSEAAGIGEFNSCGAWTKRFHAGQSAMDGVLAAYMGKEVDFLSRVLFLGGIHKTYPGSISCCTGAAAVIPGTVVYEARSGRTGDDIMIGHPSGVVDVEAVCGCSVTKSIPT